MTTYKEAAIKVLKGSKIPLTVSEILRIAKDKGYIVFQKDREPRTPEKTIGAYINVDMKENSGNSFFIKTSPGKFIYNKKCTRRPTVKTKIDIQIEKESEKTAKMFLGKGGELIVSGELTFRGFYTSSMVVDDGVDIYAVKGKKQFLIQVKTRSINGEKTMPYPINKLSFERYNDKNTFYVFVRHEIDKNTFFIFDYTLINEVLSTKSGNSDHYQVRILKEGEKFFVLKNKLKVQLEINNWKSIK